MTTMISMTVEKGLYQSQFENLQKSLRAEPSWLAGIRKAAMDRFLALGFPTTHDEDWRFTSVAPISRIPFKAARSLPRGAALRKNPTALTFGDWSGPQIVFVNDQFAPELSASVGLRNGVLVESLESVLTSQPELLSAHLSRHAGYDEHTFVALNTGFFQSGTVVRIGKDRQVECEIRLG